MKKYFYWIFGIAELAILIGLSIFLAITKGNFWWLGGVGIIFFISDIIFGVILFYQSIKVTVTEIERNPEQVIEIIKEKIVTDKDNPDNFIFIHDMIYNVGETGIRIMKIVGRGSELGHTIVCLVNLSIKDRLEMIRLKDNIAEDKIQREVLAMAGLPQSEVSEEIQTGYDEFGRAIQKRVQKKLSPQQKQEEEEVKKLEEDNVA